MKQKFIVLETIYGGEKYPVGVLKRVQTNYPHDKFVICHSEDAGRVDSMSASEILDHNIPISPLREVFLELAARSQVCFSTITTALMQNKIVLCKNFTIASKVGYKMNFPAYEKFWLEAEAISRSGLFEPDLTIFIDVDPEVAFEKMRDQGTADVRGIKFYKEMRKLYLEELSELPKDKIMIIASGVNNDATFATMKPFFDDLFE